MTRILAIDPAQNMGVAWSDDGTLHPERSGVWMLGSAKTPGARYCVLLDRLKTAPLKPTHIAYEDAFSKSNAGTRWFNGYRAVVELFAEWIGAEFLPIAPLSLKKWATGVGLAAKEDREANPDIEKTRMRSALCWAYPEHEEFGRIDQNRIDALWVLAWGWAQVEPECDAARRVRR